MIDIKMVRRDNIPCWYELSWTEKPKPAIVLRAHQDFIKNVSAIANDAPIVRSFKTNFGFSNFIGSFDGNFGFDNAFLCKGESGGFMEFIVEIPQMKKETNINCQDCKGKGKVQGAVCLHCEGSGKRHSFNWQKAYAISASFTVFFLLSRFPEKETSSSSLQLMAIQTATDHDLNGCPIDGEFSAPLCAWMDSLRENGESEIREMIQAMQISHKKMFGKLSDLGMHEFHAWVAGEKGGWLNTSCPGDACGLNPDSMGTKKGSGYEFSSHNVDSPAQQIELIASLAALHDKARESGP